MEIRTSHKYRFIARYVAYYYLLVTGFMCGFTAASVVFYYLT